MTQAWIQWGLHPANEAADQAANLEAMGWHGVMVFDSQSLLSDPYVTLALASTKTSRLGLGIGVSNTVTRNPAVTAAAIASLQAASGGRAVLGIGRGNSSLAYLGAGPARLSDFERAVRDIRRYLAGEGVDLDSVGDDASDPLSVTTGHRPDESRLGWLDERLPPATLEVAGTGRRVLGIGARLGDRVSVSVGANLERLAWAAEQVRSQVPPDREPPGLSAYVSVVALEDEELACYLAGPEVAMHAHILAFQKSPDLPLSEQDGKTVRRVAEVYDMTRHGDFGPQTEALDPAFIRDNAVVGRPDAVVGKLRAIAALGYDRIVFMLPIRGGVHLPDVFSTVGEAVLPRMN